MTAEIHELRKARKPRPIQLPRSAMLVAASLGLSVPATFTHFRLRRRRKGTEVWLTTTPAMRHERDGTTVVVPFEMNLSADRDEWPPTFEAARKWVKAYAAGHGLVLEEIVPERQRYPKPSPEDRRLLKEGGCKEEWLGSDVPELWAEAMCRCRHPGGFCGQDGFCHYGDCRMAMRQEAEVMPLPGASPSG